MSTLVNRREKITDFRGLLFKIFWEADEPEIDNNENEKNEVILNIDSEYEEDYSKSNEIIKSLEKEYDSNNHHIVASRSKAKRDRKNVLGKISVNKTQVNEIIEPNKGNASKNVKDKELVDE